MLLCIYSTQCVRDGSVSELTARLYCTFHVYVFCLSLYFYVCGYQMNN